MAKTELSVYADGGLRSLSIQGATPEALACVRRLVEPVVACPLIGADERVTLRLTPAR